MNVHEKLWEKKKAVCLSVWEWKKVELFTFENIWIWLDLPIKVFILDESIKTGKIRTNKRL